ncbi:hypothetical protein KKC91_05315 [bacterium]|nr:hypothetical protein [bacterium]
MATTILICSILVLIIVVAWRLIIKRIEEKDFWPILTICLIAIVGLIQIDIKYNEIVKNKINIKNLTLTAVDVMAYTIGRTGKVYLGDDYGLIEVYKEARNKFYKLLKESGFSEAEIDDALSNLDEVIENDVKLKLEEMEKRGIKKEK